MRSGRAGTRCGPGGGEAAIPCREIPSQVKPAADCTIMPAVFARGKVAAGPFATASRTRPEHACRSTDADAGASGCACGCDPMLMACAEWCAAAAGCAGCFAEWCGSAAHSSAHDAAAARFPVKATNNVNAANVLAKRNRVPDSGKREPLP